MTATPPTHEEITEVIEMIKTKREKWWDHKEYVRKLDIELIALRCLLLSLDHIFDESAKSLGEKRTA